MVAEVVGQLRIPADLDDSVLPGKFINLDTSFAFYETSWGSGTLEYKMAHFQLLQPKVEQQNAGQREVKVHTCIRVQHAGQRSKGTHMY